MKLTKYHHNPDLSEEDPDPSNDGLAETKQEIAIHRLVHHRFEHYGANINGKLIS